MIIVYISQQLGNQMFQYALGRHLELMGKEVKFWAGYYESFPHHDFALPRIFNLNLPQADQSEVQEVFRIRRRIYNRIIKKLTKKDRYLIHEITEVCGPQVYNPRVFHINYGILNGYWQSEKYFLPIADTIRKSFTFCEPSFRNKEMAKEMSEYTSVSIHVRRGDYAGLFPLLDKNYYDQAMSYFLHKYKDVRFYVFSNDIPWCRENLNSDSITFVDWNTGLDSPYDMWLMTQCRHNIIANSSFSWWGAWLNSHEGKEVIAPRVWDFQKNRSEDIYCPGWMTI